MPRVLRYAQRNAAIAGLPGRPHHIPAHATTPCSTWTAPEDRPARIQLRYLTDEVELLARMEHTRWVAERILAGWTLGPKDKAARRSPSLVAWEALPEDIRELDREPVRNLPALLAAAGLYVERADGPTAQRDKPSS